MFICPNCNKKGIGFWSKLWSGSDTLSKCNFCGNLSYVHSKYRFGLQSGWPTLTKISGAFLSIYLFYITNNILYLSLLPLILLACSFWELASLPMSTTTEAQANQSKRYGNWFLFGVAVLIGVIYFANNL